ncbi:MAG: hypothetical protein WCB27_16140 [Thermoguttaceae bacterium]
MPSERTRREDFSTGPDSFSEDFSSTATAVEGGSVTVIHGIYAHTLPLAGLTVRQARGELEERMNIDPEAMATVDGHEVDEDTVLQENQCLNFVKHSGEKGVADSLTIENGQVIATSEEGRRLAAPETDLLDMLRREILPPTNGVALPDGIKFIIWRNPFLLVVHQSPPHVRRLLWIADDSPCEFGPGTAYRWVRLSLPYAFTFAMFFCHGKSLHLTQRNELYFGNQPLGSLDDRLGYPALLNISCIERPGRMMAWICTQHLAPQPDKDWTCQLEALLSHTWNGGFNRSSERHEGASWYSQSKGIHPDLHPVERWEEASEDDAFALKVPWKPVGLTVGELIDHKFEEQQSESAVEGCEAARPPASLVARFLTYAQSKPSRRA